MYMTGSWWISSPKAITDRVVRAARVDRVFWSHTQRWIVLNGTTWVQRKFIWLFFFVLLKAIKAIYTYCHCWAREFFSLHRDLCACPLKPFQTDLRTMLDSILEMVASNRSDGLGTPIAGNRIAIHFAVYNCNLQSIVRLSTHDFLKPNFSKTYFQILPTFLLTKSQTKWFSKTLAFRTERILLNKWSISKSQLDPKLKFVIFILKWRTFKSNKFTTFMHTHIHLIRTDI